jgi:DNA-binding FadR family transcriptional regulator
MAKPLSVRVSEYRRRQKAAGMVSVTLLVPEVDASLYRDMASVARHRKRESLRKRTEECPAPDRPLPAAQTRLAKRWLAASGLKLQIDQPGLKLGEVLARCITQEILRMGWPVDRNLGSEGELKLRFGVGRNVLREAIRMLEYQSVARMRRGPNGGLVVVEPELESTAYLAGLYLEFRGIANSDLLRTRRELQFSVLERCMDRIDEGGRRTLRAFVAAERKLKGTSAPPALLQQIHTVLAKLTGDPTLELLTELMLRLSRNHARLHVRPSERSLLRETVALHDALAQAILAGDRVKARHFMDKQMNLVQQRLL